MCYSKVWLQTIYTVSYKMSFSYLLKKKRSCVDHKFCSPAEALHLLYLSDRTQDSVATGKRVSSSAFQLLYVVYHKILIWDKPYLLCTYDTSSLAHEYLIIATQMTSN